ncbi:acyl dehydratase [Actinoplanes lutulentus]|uniref:MaoC dehydratase-like protein n=1 Tax=Actinoplanes lutulentus TaxID=1287878 RepID=A0A327ZMT4_9ACTN|nr:MaoC family dehydratase N-terminal domain-containing protein [Actinoplanes lutulentus]MBB2944384.1 acyl dehydratase [Actinoplanes lutulentus]RAK42384.1 MaoC dehydratase-like protein [Actinoplanes lutulentus]
MTLLSPSLLDRIGEEVVYTAPEPLGRAAIRYFALATGDTDPAHLAGDIAPPTLICETNQYANLPRDTDGYAGHGWHLDVPGTRLVRGGNAYRFERPVLPSTVVTARWKLADITERVTGSGKRMLVVTSVATYTDQHGLVLVVNEESLIYVER